MSADGVESSEEADVVLARLLPPFVGEGDGVGEGDVGKGECRRTGDCAGHVAD